MELKIYVNNEFLSLYFYKEVLPINIIFWQWCNKLSSIFVYILYPSSQHAQ